MSGWRYGFTSKAGRELRKVPKDAQSRVIAALDRLLFEFNHPEEPKVSNLKAMHGKHEGEWRLRVQDYRVVFERQGARLVILVLQVGNRRDMYKP